MKEHCLRVESRGTYMENITVDPDLCIGCGLCADICPEVFEMGDDGQAHVIDANKCKQSDCCAEARDSCPTDAIKFE